MSITMEQLTQEYLDRRDQLEKLKQEFKDRETPIKNEMDKIEQAMHRIMNDQGVTSMKTPAGTPYLQTWTSTKVADWEEAFRYIQQHERWDMLQRAVNKTAVLESEEPVPGIEVQQGYKVNVRRS